MELGKEGATVTCPSCKMTARIIRKTRRNDSPTKAEVAYVNDQGQECVFTAKFSDKM